MRLWCALEMPEREMSLYLKALSFEHVWTHLLLVPESKCRVLSTESPATAELLHH